MHLKLLTLLLILAHFIYEPSSVFIIWLTSGWNLWHCFGPEITHFPFDVGQIYGK